VDVELWLSDVNASSFLQALSEPYYVSAQELTDQLASEDEFRMVQVMHLDEAFRFDCFLQGRTPMDSEAHAMKRSIELLPGKPVFIACAEHIFVQKLRWYDAGRRVSERQLRDLSALASTAPLDWARVFRWAAMFRLEDLAASIKSHG
jgi:hypothetical protein